MMESIRDMLDKAKHFVKRHLSCFACGALMFVLLIIGSSLSGSANSKIDAANRTLSDIKNVIANYDATLQNKNVVYETPETDFDKVRYSNDLKAIANYMVDCFEFSNYDEYEAKRKVLMNRLGADHQFFSDFMTEYTPVKSDQYDENATVDDGKNLSCHIVSKSISPTLSKYDTETGVNKYVTTLSTVLVLPKKFDGDFLTYSTEDYDKTRRLSIMVTCSVNANGEISDFDAYAIC